MRWYPSSYSAADEILAVHREMTTGLPWPARRRADMDLVGHALRVRLRLDSAAASGRFFEVTAPFALGVAAAYGGIQLMRWWAGVVISPGSTWSQLRTTDLRLGLHTLFLLLMTVGGIAALIKYWRLGVTASVLGLLGFAADWLVSPGLYDAGPLQAATAVLTALMVLACPPDRRGEHTAIAGGMAAIAWFPSALVLTRGFVISTDYGAWPLLVLVLTALACYARRATLQILAAAPLFLVHAAISL